jgi:hypothetical protein
MHEENLKIIYDQLKACIRNQFSNYLVEDDRYENYFTKCSQQRQDIHNYYSPQFEKYLKTNPANDEFLNGEVEKGVFILTKYGWDEKRGSNMYILTNLVLLIILRRISDMTSGLIDLSLSGHPIAWELPISLIPFLTIRHILLVKSLNMNLNRLSSI